MTQAYPQQKKETYFTKRMFLRFFIPSLAASLGLALGNIVDALVVGVRMGAPGLAAIGLATPVFMIFNVFDIGLAVGGSICYSKLLGQGKVKLALANFNQMLLASLSLGVLLALLGNLFLPQVMLLLGAGRADTQVYALCQTYVRILLWGAPLFFLNFLLYYYVRSDDNQKLASLGFIVGNVADIGLNILFVLVWDLGVAGACYATLIGRVLAIAIYLPHLFFRWSILRLQWVKPDFRLIWDNFCSGFSVSSQYIFQFVLLAVLNHLLLALGGTIGAAVFNVTVNVSYVLLSVFEGTGSAIQPLCATLRGENNYPAERGILYLGLRWGMSLGVLLALAIGFFAQPIALLFGLVASEAVDLCVQAVRLYCLSGVIGGYAVLLCSYYSAVGLERYVPMINFLRGFAVYLLCALLFSTGDILLFWLVFPLNELISLLLWQAIKSVWEKKRPPQLLEEGRVYHKTIDNQGEDFSQLTQEVESFCEQWSADFKQQYYVNLTVEEICQAIILNGFRGQGNEYIELTLIAMADNSFELHIRDNAVDFNPFGMQEEGLDAIGVNMVKSKAKDFFYRRYMGFNTLIVRV